MGASPERVAQLTRHAHFWAALGTEAFGRWLESVEQELPAGLQETWPAPAGGPLEGTRRTAEATRPEAIGVVLSRLQRLA